MLSIKKSRQIDSINQVINYSVISSLDDLSQNPVYKIKVDLVDILEPSIVYSSETSPTLTDSLKQIQELLIFLYNNTVMPAHLDNIIDEYITDNDNFIFSEEENFITT